MEIGQRHTPTVDVGDFNPAAGEIGYNVLFDVPALVITAYKVLLMEALHLGHAQDGQKVPVTLVDETDNVTEEIGVVTPTIELSKNGAAYAALSDGTWAEIGQGDYTVTLDKTDTDTLGWAMLRVVKASVSSETKVLLKISTSYAEQRADYIRTRTEHRRRG